MAVEHGLSGGLPRVHSDVEFAHRRVLGLDANVDDRRQTVTGVDVRLCQVELRCRVEFLRRIKNPKIESVANQSYARSLPYAKDIVEPSEITRGPAASRLQGKFVPSDDAPAF